MGSDLKRCGRGRAISLDEYADEGPDGVDYVAFTGEKLTLRQSTKREPQTLRDRDQEGGNSLSVGVQFYEPDALRYAPMA